MLISGYLCFFCKGWWVFLSISGWTKPADQLPHPSPESLASPPQNLVEGRKVRISRVDLKLGLIQKPKIDMASIFQARSMWHCAKHKLFSTFFFVCPGGIFSIKFPDFREWFESFFPMKGTFSWVCCFCAKNTKKDNLLLSTLAPFPSHQLGKSSSFRGW